MRGIRPSTLILCFSQTNERDSSEYINIMFSQTNERDCPSTLILCFHKQILEIRTSSLILCFSQTNERFVRVH